MVWGIVIGLVVVVVVGYFLAPKAAGSNAAYKASEVEAKKQENINKILDFIKDKDRFTNNDLENLLGVSNTTIGRYLEELEKSGKITQHGTIGIGVYYTKK